MKKKRFLKRRPDRRRTSFDAAIAIFDFTGGNTVRVFERDSAHSSYLASLQILENKSDVERVGGDIWSAIDRTDRELIHSGSRRG